MYPRWLRRKCRAAVLTNQQGYFETLTLNARDQVSDSLFWRAVTANIREFNDEYQARTGQPLYVNPTLPEICRKSYQSFLLKTWRKNVLTNKNWPNEPTGGWVFPPKWYEAINDSIRTTFVVKYLDGVEFQVGKLASLCVTHGLRSDVDWEARASGYYAAHFYAHPTVSVPGPRFEMENITISFEMQITTQLQDVLRRLTHTYYEARRTRGTAEEGKPWQWDYKSDEFAPNYLGHVLQYLEGMVMQIRDKQEEAR